MAVDNGQGGRVVRIDPSELRRVIERADRPEVAVNSKLRLAAVFVLLVEREDTRLLLIRRADRGDPWSNQMAFPGGHVDPTDPSALDAAYRETFEEVGIRRSAIAYIGDLGNFQTHMKKVNVRTFIGMWDGREALRTDPAEVAQAVEIPILRLIREHTRQGYDRKDVVQLGDDLIYELTDQSIWGVTARIVHDLITKLSIDNHR